MEKKFRKNSKEVSEVLSEIYEELDNAHNLGHYSEEREVFQIQVSLGDCNDWKKLVFADSSEIEENWDSFSQALFAADTDKRNIIKTLKTFTYSYNNNSVIEAGIFIGNDSE